MIFVMKNEFQIQLDNLSRKYKLVKDDFEDFKNNFSLINGKHLGKGIYKFRMKNSSIPTGKSAGFRLILLARIQDNKIMPFIIYSKSEKENITLNEIIDELKKYQ